MSNITKIEWTDATFNPWIGCTKVHQGCANCYAERDFDHRHKRVKWGPTGTRSMTADWTQPLSLNRRAQESGKALRIFCASLADVFEDWTGPIMNHKGEQLFYRRGTYGTSMATRQYVGIEAGLAPQCDLRPVTMQDLRRELFELIDATPCLRWQILTKRPENILAMMPPRIQPDGTSSQRRENVWLLTSVADQATAEALVPRLLEAGHLVPVVGISAEPLLGAIDLTALRYDGWTIDALRGVWYDGQTIDTLRDVPGLPTGNTARLGLVIAGGESGPNARPCHPRWAQSLANQCHAEGVPYFFKQWGEWFPFTDWASQHVGIPDETPTQLLADDGTTALRSIDLMAKNNVGLVARVGKAMAGRELFGRLHNGMPAGWEVLK